MLTAALFGLLASSGLLIGAIIGLIASPSRRVVASIIAFGSGVLVSALTFELMEDAFEKGNPYFVAGGFLVGALIYIGASSVLDRLAAASATRDGRHARDVEGSDAEGEQAETAARENNQERGRKDSPEAATVSGTALLVGAVLDGIPENVAIGVSLYTEGKGLGFVLLAAVFLGNLPESIGSSVGMRQEGRSRGYILGVWGAATVACTLASVAGYALLGGLPPHLISAVLALAAGGILAMLADTMMPEAFENGGPAVAFATAVGFLCAAFLSHLAH
jgi:ZIP family zinc transporter